MIIDIDENAEIKEETNICPHHQENPGSIWAGCTCSRSWSRVIKYDVEKGS